MKKSFVFISIIIMLFAAQPIYAADVSGSPTVESSSIEWLDDGSYYLTVIEDVPSEGIVPFAAKTVTKSKTAYYKSAKGVTLWQVKVTGTFTYGNGTAKCTKATPSAAAKASSWKVSNISSSRSGNKASAKATGKQYANGIMTQSVTKSVTLTCNSKGQVQ